MNSWIRAFRSRVTNVFRSTRAEVELTREIEAHLNLIEEDLKRGGMTVEEARRESRRRLGGVERTMDLHREQRSLQWLDTFLQDLRYACRSFRNHPVFSITVVLTLGLGIGATSAIFSIVNGVLLRPLPYKDADRIVRIVQKRALDSAPDNVPLRMDGISKDDLQQWRDRTSTFEQMAGYSPIDMVLIEGGEAARVRVATLSPAMFPLLGATPLLGRTFAATEESPGKDSVAILSHAAWQKYFAGDPQILRRSVSLNGRAHTIVGIMPPEFGFPNRETELWTPLVIRPIVRTTENRTIELVHTLARLADGVSIEASTAEGNSLFVGFRRTDNRFYEENPGPGGFPLIPPTPFGADERITIELVSIKEELVRPVRPALLALLGAVGLVLLIACGNVANLLLARAGSRELEIAVRTALGASRNRIIQQALTESMMLAVFSGMLGIVLAVGGLELFTKMDIGNIPRSDEIELDVSVFTFTLATSILAGILFGLVPALRVPPAAPSRSFRRNRTRSVLVVAEIAIAVILTTGAGLLISSFLNLSHIDRGYNPENVLTFRLSLPEYSFRGLFDPTENEQVLRRIRDVSGVRLAAIGNVMPTLQEGGMNAPIFVEGRPEPTRPEDVVRASIRSIGADYLRAMGMRVLEGRDFAETDRVGQPAVMLVNRTFAQSFFRTEPSIGKRLRLGRGSSRPPVEIVGVVDDVQYQGLDRAVQGPEIYLNLQQAASVLPPIPPPLGIPRGAFPRGTWVMGPMVFAVRTTADPFDLVEPIRGVIREVNSRLIMDDVATMEQRLSPYIVQPRLYARLLGAFSVVAVTLAVTGIYGLIAYSISQRTKEIGIRVAIGARPIQVLTFVVKEGLILIAAGLLTGILGALALTRYLDNLLFGLTATDPFTFVLTVAFMFFVGIMACCLPARRALRLDPLIALRNE